MKKFLLSFKFSSFSNNFNFYISKNTFLKIKIIEFETRALYSLPMEVFLCEKLNGIFAK